MGVAAERDEAPPPVRESTCVVDSVSALVAAEPFMLNVGPGALASNTVEADTMSVGGFRFGVPACAAWDTSGLPFNMVTGP